MPKAEKCDAPSSAQEHGEQKHSGSANAQKRVLTYGTFDLLHYGHIRLLKRAAALGDYLIVALSSDEFNASKGKSSFYSYEMRKEMLEALRCVDEVIPENSWEQKAEDVRAHKVDIVVMGSDWKGSERFEYLRELCDVVYLERTEGISSSQIKDALKKEGAQKKD